MILLTPSVTQDSNTVWATRVDSDEKTTSGFGGWLTYRTNSGNGYSDGGGYYWFVIGIWDNPDESVGIA